MSIPVLMPRSRSSSPKPSARHSLSTAPLGDCPASAIPPTLTRMNPIAATPLDLDSEPEWVARAACKASDPELFISPFGPRPCGKPRPRAPAVESKQTASSTPSLLESSLGSGADTHGANEWNSSSGANCQRVRQLESPAHNAEHPLRSGVRTMPSSEEGARDSYQEGTMIENPFPRARWYRK